MKLTVLRVKNQGARTMKPAEKIIKKILDKKANEFDVEELVKIFAENKMRVTLGEEVMFKEYIRRGAEQLGIDLRDIQAVYNSYSRQGDIK